MRPLATRQRISSLRTACAAAAALGVLVGCSRAAPVARPAPAPVAAPPPTVAAAPPASPTIAWSAGRARYDYASAATVALEGDTSRTGERVSTTALLTLVATLAGPELRATVSVDSFAITASARVGGSDRLRAPTRIDATIDTRTGELRVDDRLPTDCASPLTSARLIARSVLVPLPASLAPGATWSDSTTTETCRGGLLIRTHGVARYALDPASGGAASEPLRITRRTTATLAGSPSLGTVGATLAGTSSGVARLAIDPRSGRLLSLDGESTTDLTITAGTRTRKLRQQATERVTLRR